jgi:CheY-specific phosphatase CheX
LSAPHTHLNTIVQGSTVELFHACGIAVAPLPAGQLASGHGARFGLTGMVTFNAPKLSGSLALSLADEIYGLLTPPASGAAAISDALRELTNQLAGRVKNRLLQFQVVLSVGIPTTVNGPLFARGSVKNETITLCPFRTLRGEVRVVLTAAVEEGALSYSNAVKVAKEGDFIPF